MATSKVGVNVDEFSEDPTTLSGIVDILKAENKQFWIDRASQQILLTMYRFNFRPSFMPNKYQLPLTQPNHWKFEFHGKPTRDRSIDGHDLVYINYTWSTYLLSDFESPGISEPMLENIGGKWIEPIVLPCDPYHLLQRTGYACMDEGDFPIPSVHPERTEWFYDDTCDIEEPHVASPNQGCLQCHCSQTVNISCVDALKENIGSVNVSFIFTRLPWNQTQANRIRKLSDPQSTTHPEDADQNLLTSGLAAKLIEYKYFSSNSCEIHEPCIGGTGWRRLLLFDSSDENIGGTSLTIGQIYTLTDNATQEPAEVTNHGLYQYDTCHHHYHFKYYGTFTYDNEQFQNSKRGFCIMSTGRQANAEWSPLWSSFYNCIYQGNSPGWTDTYQAGIPCQWIDITDYNTTNSSTTAFLKANMNPDNMLCEGQLVLDADSNFIWEQTNFTAIDGQTVYKPECVTGTNPSTLANNIDEVQITLPTDGHGYVTEPCFPYGQHIGSEKNCGFMMKSPMEKCQPGEITKLTCLLETNLNCSAVLTPQVVRICESSQVLNTGLACDYNTALNNMVVNSSSTSVITFMCPSFRDSQELGGLYSIYVASIMDQLDDQQTTVVCEQMQ
ncbi:unnamed protein product [Adineta steineri]|uniref:Uncharacterized protein n=1 Tax=Adineta steineri TaxID=433720 RepID=A0A813XJP3_9BILA|nr:unnamed protein product [Adineta steineri]CAF3714541.1 unnamed protein product [Adineta steineri]